MANFSEKAMRNRNWIVVATVLGASILCLFFLAGCQKPSISTETLLVPEKANAIAKVKIAKILNDKDIADLYARYVVTDPDAPQTLRLALDELKEKIGVDLRYFDEAVLFADVSTLENGIPYWGAIVECNVPAKYFFEVLGEPRGTHSETQKYRSYKIYTFKDEISFTFLDSNLLTVGSENAVKDVIDVRLGRSKPISGELYELYDALDNPLFKGASKVPWTITKQIPTELPLDNELIVNLRPLRDVYMVSCVLDKSGETIYIEVQMQLATNSSAVDAKRSAEDLITGAKRMWPLPEVNDLLDKVQVSIYDSQVLVKFDATITELEDLIGAFEREYLL